MSSHRVLSLPVLPMLLVMVLLVIVPTVPAAAGDADDPETTDPCGPGAEVDILVPWTDLCAAWVSVDGDVLTAGLQVSGELADRPESYYGVEWTGDDGCDHRISTGDRSVTDRIPDLPNVHRSGDEGYVSFAVICQIPEICDRYGCYDRKWRAYASFDLDARDEDGSVMTFTVDLGELPEIADAYEPGDVLSGLTAWSGIGFPGGLVYSDETPAGRDYEIAGS